MRKSFYSNSTDGISAESSIADEEIDKEEQEMIANIIKNEEQ